MNSKSETFSHPADTPTENCRMARSVALIANLVKFYNLSTESSARHRRPMQRSPFLLPRCNLGVEPLLTFNEQRSQATLLFLTSRKCRKVRHFYIMRKNTQRLDTRRCSRWLTSKKIKLGIRRNYWNKWRDVSSNRFCI